MVCAFIGISNVTLHFHKIESNPEVQHFTKDTISALSEIVFVKDCTINFRYKAINDSHFYQQGTVVCIALNRKSDKGQVEHFKNPSFFSIVTIRNFFLCTVIEAKIVS